jgi:hypothetical protein
MGMTKQWVEGVAISVITNTDQQPKLFIWQGKEQRVIRILEEWEIDTRWWQGYGRIWCVCYSVITDVGLLCVLYQSFLDGVWYFSALYD